LDIGNIDETFSVNSPILVPAAGVDFTDIKDGAQLLKEIAYLQYSQDILSGAYVPNNRLPLLVEADLKIGSQESSISFQLKSDGDPNNTASVYQIDTGYNSDLGLDSAARVAKNWDFAVQLGDLNYYVKDLNMNLKIETKSNNFLGSYKYVNDVGLSGVPFDGLNNGEWSEGEPEIGSYTGWQFPFLSIGGISLTASGSAAVSLANDVNAGPNINFNYINVDSPITTRDEMFTGNGGYPGFFNVDAQQPGEFTYGSGTTFRVYRLQTNGTTVSLGPSLLPEAFDGFNNSIVSMKDIKFSADLLTFNFNVEAFVTQL
jgi:hypothetical protein